MKMALASLLFLPALAFAVSTKPVSALLWWEYPVELESSAQSFLLERKAGQCRDKAAFVEIARPAKTIRFYADQALSPGLTYCWRVLTVGLSGEKSPPSNAVSKTIPVSPNRRSMP